MPLKLDGTYGVSGIVGTASSAAVYGADADSGIVFGGNQTLINSDGSTIATVGSSGINVTGVVTSTTLRTTSIVGVTTAGITTVYTNSINNGQLGGSRNIIINGSMVVNQRGFTGTAGTTASSGTFSVDRFYNDNTTDGVVSVGQTTMNSTIGGNAYVDGFRNALITRITTADSSLAAGQVCAVVQPIEGYNVQGIKKGTANAQPVTLSFWVRSSTIGNYVCELFDNDNTRQVSQAYTINAANTWEKKVLTFAADTTGVFDNDNNVSLYAIWWLAAGSTFSGGTLNTSWAAANNANRAVGQVNALAAVGDFWLTGVQLEVGDRATEFERRSYGDELRLCQRYFCGVDTRPYSAAYHYFGTAVEWSSTTIMCGMTFPVTMRARPTSLFISDRNTFYIGGYTSFTSAVIDQIGVAGGYILFTGSGFSNSGGGRWLSNNNNTAYCYFNAELV